MKVAFFGPYIGELGWEVMTWQAWCRKESKKFDKSYACSFPDMKYLYEDFATFIPHTHQGRALNWHKIENIEKVIYAEPIDVDEQFFPPKCYRAKGNHIKFGDPPLSTYRYLLHARAISRGSKNYPPDKWYEVARSLTGPTASIGSKLDYHVPGTTDLRGIDLQMLTRYMQGASYVIGGSSGVMHLACLCGPEIITWGDSRTYFGETLEKRYKETWNPLNASVTFLFDDNWCPDPSLIVQSTGGPMEEKDKGARLAIPNELWAKISEAVGNGRYFMTISHIDQGGTIQHYWQTSQFQTGDMVPSLDVISADVKVKTKVAPVIGHGGVESADVTPAEPVRGVGNWK